MWKPIERLGVEVSRDGRVRNARTRHIYAARATKTNRYARLTIRRAGRRNYYVHRLIAEAFLGVCPPGREVNHKNGVKTDNRASNLEYITRRENIFHSFALRLHIPVKGEQNGKAKLTASTVRAMRKLYATGTPTRELARRFNVSVSGAQCAIQRKTWKHVD